MKKYHKHILKDITIIRTYIYDRSNVYFMKPFDSKLYTPEILKGK